MLRTPRLLIASVFLLVTSRLALSQPQSTDLTRGRSEGDPAMLVAAVAGLDQVRFTALALTKRIRLEVLSQTGDVVFDSDDRPGSIVEWPVQDSHGSLLPDGIYGCLVTVEGLDGSVSQRKGIFRVQEGRAQVERLSGDLAAAAEDGQDEFTVLQAPDPAPFTLVSHDGNEGWVESASGGLSFYAGSISRNRDSIAHLRLTPEGNLGIGVAEPQAKLDVAGVIRASEGFQFSDGTILTMQDGFPVLLTGSQKGAGNNSLGTTFKIGSIMTRPLATSGRVGPVYGTEGASNTFYGTNAGNGSMTGTLNSFFGVNSGSATTSGAGNTFAGWGAGVSNASGNDNSFFGAGAGNKNTASDNAFFGQNAGNQNTTGTKNAFFGKSAGQSNTSGGYNSFFGNQAGSTNTSASDNAFFGASAGKVTTGSQNSFFGSAAGMDNTTGSSNSFFGIGAGALQTTAYENSFFGAQTGGFSGSQNSFFGAWTGNVNLGGSLNAFFGYYAGQSNHTGNDNSFVGAYAGTENDTGYDNVFVGRDAGYSNTTGFQNSFLGRSAGYANTIETGNTFLGYLANFYPGSNPSTNPVTNATAIGNRAYVAQSNSLVLGSINGINGATADTNVGIGTTAPGARLDIVGVWGAPGASIPTNWADRVTGRRGVVRGNQGFYEDVYLSPDGYYAELSTYKWDDNSTIPLVLLANGGNVAVGNNLSPGAKLDVVGSYGLPGASVPSGWAERVTGRRGLVRGNRGFYEDVFQGAYGYYAELSTFKWDDGTAFPLVFNANGGNVGIGTANPQERLHVNGNLRVAGSIIYGAPEEEIPDYVFEPGYRLMPVEELAAYLAREKHLPNVPAASEIEEQGLNLGEFQMRLLEKIEELTLYTVQQAKTIGQKDREINALRAEASRQREASTAMDVRLAALEQALERLSPQEQK